MTLPGSNEARSPHIWPEGCRRLPIWGIKEEAASGGFRKWKALASGAAARGQTGHTAPDAAEGARQSTASSDGGGQPGPPKCRHPGPADPVNRKWECLGLVLFWGTVGKPGRGKGTPPPDPDHPRCVQGSWLCKAAGGSSAAGLGHNLLSDTSLLSLSEAPGVLGP